MTDMQSDARQELESLGYKTEVMDKGEQTASGVRVREKLLRATPVGGRFLEGLVSVDARLPARPGEDDPIWKAMLNLVRESSQ